MSTSEDINKSLERLYARQNLGMKFGLDVMESLLKRMGNPERGFQCVHVAGTNGKGSVCAMLDSIFRAAGYRTGLYTSPHLIRFNERIRVNGQDISDNELAALFEKIEKPIAETAAELGREPTFFECATAMAFEHFRAGKVQIAVLETGLGGRLDATNVVTPLVSVITGLGVEHTAYLGKDLKAIAREKCGVIKPGKPIVCGPLDEEAMEVVRRAAREKGSELVDAGDRVSVRQISAGISGQKVAVETANLSYGAITLPLAGPCQAENLATAIATIETLIARGFPEIEPRRVKAGISSVKWPGRFQVLRTTPPVILDGAHNPSAGKALAETLNQTLKGKALGLVIGMCDDKDLENFLKNFGKQARRLWAVQMKTYRSLPPTRISEVARTIGLQTSEATLPDALSEAEKWAAEIGGAICVCGSLYLVGEALEMIENLPRDGK